MFALIATTLGILDEFPKILPPTLVENQIQSISACDYETTSEL